MFIEVSLKSKLVSRIYCHLPEPDGPIRADQTSFRERCEAKTDAVNLILNNFIATRLPDFQNTHGDVELSIILESKMNESEEVKNQVSTPPDAVTKKVEAKSDEISVTEKVIIKSHMPEPVIFSRAPGEYSNPQLPAELTAISDKRKVDKSQFAMLPKVKRIISQRRINTEYWSAHNK
jgi:hypothetical protein